MDAFTRIMVSQVSSSDEAAKGTAKKVRKIPLNRSNRLQDPQSTSTVPSTAEPNSASAAASKGSATPSKKRTLAKVEPNIPPAKAMKIKDEDDDLLRRRRHITGISATSSVIAAEGNRSACVPPSSSMQPAVAFSRPPLSETKLQFCVCQKNDHWQQCHKFLEAMLKAEQKVM